jgi:hypothetical protein
LPVAFIARFKCEPPGEHHGEDAENGSEFSHWTAKKNDGSDDYGDEYPWNDCFPHGKVVVQRAERPGCAAKGDDPGTRPQNGSQCVTNHFNDRTGKRAGIVTMEIRVNSGGKSLRHRDV